MFDTALQAHQVLYRAGLFFDETAVEGLFANQGQHGRIAGAQVLVDIAGVVGVRHFTADDQVVSQGGEHAQHLQRCLQKNRSIVQPHLGYTQSQLSETVVVKNRESAYNLVARVKTYKSSAVECLIWDAVGLKRKWTTETAPGYISDMAVADMDGDGVRDIAFTVVDSGSLFDFQEATTYLTIRWGRAAE